MTTAGRKKKREDKRAAIKQLMKDAERSDIEAVSNRMKAMEVALQASYQRIDAKDGDVIALFVDPATTPKEIQDRIGAGLVQFLRSQGRRVLVMTVPAKDAIAHLPEDAMRTHGWVRATSAAEVEKQQLALLAEARAKRRAELDAEAAERPTESGDRADAAATEPTASAEDVGRPADGTGE